jgi:hypothetical protein
MKEMIGEDYLKKIREVNGKLYHFGWMVIAHSTTLEYESKKVVLMQANGSNRRVFEDLREALLYLTPILNSKKFEKEVLEKSASICRVRYKGAVYVEAGQRNPHRPMTSTERTRMRQTLKNRRPVKKVLEAFSAPVWRAIAGKTHKGCWEVTFTYKIMGGASGGKSSNFTRCVGFDKSKKPQLKKNPSNPSGYEVVKKEK